MRISDWMSDVFSSELKWKPSNYSKEFYGPTPMRVGLEKSRNLMTVRLAQTVGMAKVADYARRFGVVANLDPVLSMALAAGETTLMQMTTAYAMMVNGGKRLQPTLITRVHDRPRRTIHRTAPHGRAAGGARRGH